MKENKIGILGYGEVGQAIARFYKNPLIKDLKRDDGLDGVDILHICIPWNDNFVKAVKKEVKEIKPELTIIHSTIAPGTTKKIISDLPRDLRGVVHSPVRGVHPNLYQGIRTFIKYIGADDKKSGEAARKHLESLGIKTRVFIPSTITEIGKLLDTSYYGIVIAWHGEMKKICDKFGIDFEKAVTDFNRTYNEGYVKLGKTNVIRPLLFPPDSGCGGHCILENTILLREALPDFSSVFDFVLSMGKDETSIFEDKPYLNKTWLYGAYWGQNRSSKDIGKQFGVTGENICAIMKRRGIPTRDMRWTRKQISLIKKLAERGKTFKEIGEYLERHGKTYDAVRNIAYKNLKIKSNYSPALSSKNEEVRQKISATLQGIEFEDWEEFRESMNSLIRKSVIYQKWRKKIFEKDNYICQKCKERGGYLVAHHVANFADNSESRTQIDNGITLCKLCHLNFHNKYGRKNNNRKQIEEYFLE